MRCRIIAMYICREIIGQMSLQRVTGVAEQACREGITWSCCLFRFVYPLVAGAMVTARETEWGENNFLG
jgi:hypothetical protein